MSASLASIFIHEKSGGQGRDSEDWGPILRCEHRDSIRKEYMGSSAVFNQAKGREMLWALKKMPVDVDT